MIGQNISLEYVVPLALERLQADPYAEGDYYPGDLLVNLLRSNAGFWRRHPELRQQLVAIAERATGPSKAPPVNADETVLGHMPKLMPSSKDSIHRRPDNSLSPKGPEGSIPLAGSNNSPHIGRKIKS